MQTHSLSLLQAISRFGKAGESSAFDMLAFTITHHETDEVRHEAYTYRPKRHREQVKGTVTARSTLKGKFNRNVMMIYGHRVFRTNFRDIFAFTFNAYVKSYV